MSRKPLWVSAVMFLILLGVTWRVLNRNGRPEEEAFFSLKRATPDTLLVTYGTDTTLLVPGGKGWKVIRPVRYPADTFAVSALLKHLQDPGVETVYDLPPEKLDSYGLRFPRAVIRASYRDLPPDSLIIGGSTPNGAFDYVRPGGRRRAGLLVSQTTRSSFLKTTRDLRDTRLLDVPENRVRRITLLHRGGERLDLHREEGGEWVLGRPFPGRADQGKTREYLASLVHMTIQEFLHEEGAGSAAFGLEAPAAGVVLETDTGEKVGYSIGDSIPGEDMFFAAAMSRPNVFGVSRRYLPVLEWPDAELRQKAPTTFGLSRVGSVTVRTAGGSRRFRLSPPDSTVLPQTVDVLGSWVLLEAVRVEPATSRNLDLVGLDSPEGELIWSGEADTLAVVQVGTASHGLVPIRVPEGLEARPEEILFVPEERIRPLWVYLTRRLTTPS